MKCDFAATSGCTTALPPTETDRNGISLQVSDEENSFEEKVDLGLSRNLFDLYDLGDCVGQARRKRFRRISLIVVLSADCELGTLRQAGL